MKNVKLAPVQPAERIERIDILRGFALLGILMVNVFGYHASFYHFSAFYGGLENTLDSAIYHWMMNLGADKFIFLFSFLFGYSFWMLQGKFPEDDKGFTVFYFRRMLALGLIGLLHIILLWAGDILFIYSLLGLVLLLFSKFKNSTLISLAVIFYFFTAGLLALRVWFPYLPDPVTTLTALSMEDVAKGYTNGSFLDILWLRVNEYIIFRNINLLYYAPKILSLFIIGYVSGRLNILQIISQKQKKFSVITFVFLLIGLILTFKLEPVLLIFSNPDSPFYMSVYIFIYESGNVFLGSGYLMLIILGANTNWGLLLLDPFKYAGRMALTNYLMQSLIFTTIFYGYGFGFFAQVRPWQFLLWGLLVFIIQVIFSKIWLTWFRFGPLEYIWRRLTYGRSFRI